MFNSIAWTVYVIVAAINLLMLIFVGLMALGTDAKGPTWERPATVAILIGLILVVLGGSLLLRPPVSGLRAVVACLMAGAPVLLVIGLSIKSAMYERSPERIEQLRLADEKFRKEVEEDFRRANSQPTSEPTSKPVQ